LQLWRQASRPVALNGHPLPGIPLHELRLKIWTESDIKSIGGKNMPTPWHRRFRKEKKLAVYNMGGAWSGSVESALQTFNALGFGVNLFKATDEKDAQIVVKLSNGTDTYPHPRSSISVNFPAHELHGRAKTLMEAGRKGNEIFFAAVFLPGKVPNPTSKQKEVIIVHELIHAAGLNGKLDGGGDDPNGDHDSSGIMFPQMMVDGDGLIEYLHDKGAKAMTPIRVGPKTQGSLRKLWINEEKKD
jgi:hypothetical protein